MPTPDQKQVAAWTTPELLETLDTYFSIPKSTGGLTSRGWRNQLIPLFLELLHVYWLNPQRPTFRSFWQSLFSLAGGSDRASQDHANGILRKLGLSLENERGAVGDSEAQSDPST